MSKSRSENPQFHPGDWVYYWNLAGGVGLASFVPRSLVTTPSMAPDLQSTGWPTVLHCFASRPSTCAARHLENIALVSSVCLILLRPLTLKLLFDKFFSPSVVLIVS